MNLLKIIIVRNAKIKFARNAKMDFTYLITAV